jgi:hypothetical protein
MPQSDQPQFDSATEEATVEPIPPRYWWLRRIGVAAGFLFVALFALRLWWGWEAHRRLQAEIDRIIAAGEPIYPEDFDPKEEIPDDQNAARLLIAATDAFNFSAEQTALLGKVCGTDFPLRKRLTEVRRLVEDNAEVLRLARRARNLSEADWGVRLRTPVINMLLPALSGQRQLSRILDVAAGYRHATGNDSEAVETLRDALAHADRIQQQPSLIAQYVGWVCAELAVERTETILPTLRIADEEAVGGDGPRKASRSQVRRLLAELANEKGIGSGIRRAAMCERMAQLDTINQLRQGKTSISAIYGLRGGASWSLDDVMWRYPLLPAVMMDGVSLLRETTSLAKAAGLRTFRETQTSLQNGDEASRLHTLVHPLRNVLPGLLDRSSVRHFRALATRRLAATALGLRLYEIDHGQRAETLAELVPEYLEELPEDPFAHGGRALSYLPRAAHPIVYSVGENGVDDGGDPKRQNTVTKGYRRPDIVFFLDGWREDEKENEDETSLPPSTQTGDDDGQESADDRKEDENGEGEEKP